MHKPYINCTCECHNRMTALEKAFSLQQAQINKSIYDGKERCKNHPLTQECLNCWNWVLNTLAFIKNKLKDETGGGF